VLATLRPALALADRELTITVSLGASITADASISPGGS
jgi:hypothetical protein